MQSELTRSLQQDLSMHPRITQRSENKNSKRANNKKNGVCWINENLNFSTSVGCKSHNTVPLESNVIKISIQIVLQRTVGACAFKQIVFRKCYPQIVLKLRFQTTSTSTSDNR